MQVYSKVMQLMEKFWDMFIKIMIVTILIMVIIGIGLAFTPKVKQMHLYQQTRDRLQQRIDETVAAEKKSKNKQQRFLTDSAYVEKVAHEVGYAHKDELIFHFPDTNEADEVTP